MAEDGNMETSDAAQCLEKNIDKEITKLEYYLEPENELLECEDYTEMEIVVKLTTKIGDKITDLISQLEEIKIDQEISPRAVRQWKKETKTRYSSWIEEKDKLSRALKARQKEIDKDVRQWEAQWEREERLRRERQQQERKLWQEKLEAELRMTEKLGIEKDAKSTHIKLPKLKITPKYFK